MLVEIEGLPDKERTLVPQFVGALQACHQGALRSVVLYGGAASGDYRPGHSDINLLVVIEPLTAERLKAASGCDRVWKRKLPINPLYVPGDFVRESADVFPIELMDMARRRIVLYGDDPFRDAQITDANLRLQIEHELKGKLIRLRQSYVRDADDARAVVALMTGSLSSFVALFAAALRLKDIEPPGTQAEVIDRAAQVLGLDAVPLRRVLEGKSHPSAIPPGEAHAVFGAYLEQIQKAGEVMDEGRSEK